MLLPLLLALHLEPTDLRLVEPLRLTSGLEVEAVYYEPTDSFCLGFTDFLMTRADIEGAVATIEEERRIAGERVRVCVDDCQTTTKALVDRAAVLDAQMIEARHELEEVSRSLFWWRVGSVGVLSLSFAAVVVIAVR